MSKPTQRMAELYMRLSVVDEFKEFWELVNDRREKLISAAIHADDKALEAKGAAAAFDKFVTEVEDAPAKAKRNRKINDGAT